MTKPDNTNSSSGDVSFEETCAAYEIMDQAEYEQVMAALDNQASDGSTSG